MKKVLFSLVCFVLSSNFYGQEVEWVKQLDKTSSESGKVEITAIANDKDGNVFITGNFEGVVDFDPSAVGGELISYYGSWYSADPFVAKFDADGNYIWAKKIVSVQGLGSGNSLVVDASGNVYVAGEQYAGDLACFLVRYTAAGVQTYYYTMKGYESANQEGSIALDENGNLYFFNRFTGTNVDLDPTSGVTLKTAVGGYDAYIAKFTASTGAFQWAKAFGGPNYEYCQDIETDGTYIYVTGSYYGTMDFNPDAGVNNLTSVGNSNIYVARYLCSTGAYEYAYSFGIDHAEGYNIELDGEYLYLAVQYKGVVDFQHGVGVYTLTSASGGTNSSLALLRMKKSDLTISWGYNLPFSVQRPSMSILLDEGLLVAAALPAGTYDFNPGVGVHNITSAGNTKVVLCIDANQNFKWAVRACEPNGGYYCNVQADITGGFLFGTDFGTTVEVDPDGNSTSLSQGSYGKDAFISHWRTCIPVLITTQPIPASATICQGNTQTYSVSTSGTTPISYQWYNGAGAILGQTGASYIASESGTYYCIVTNACGTETSNSVSLTVNANVGITSATAAASPICSSATTTITANGITGTGATLTWYTGTGGTGTILGSTNPKAVGPGTYYARITGTCGGPVEASVTVAADQLPTATAGGTQSICGTETATVSGATAANGTISWTHNGLGSISAGANTITPEYTPVAGDNGTTVTLTMTVTSTNTCAPAMATATYTVIVGALPLAPSSGFSDINNFCNNDPGNITLIVAGGSGTAVHWFDDICGGNEIGTGNPFIIVSPTASTTYYARYENSCGQSACYSIPVAVVEPPVAPVKAESDRNNFCADDAGNILLSVTGGSGTTVQWFTSSCGGSSVGNGNPLSIPSPDITTTYFARWENACGTTDCVQHTVYVVPIPVAPISAATNLNNFCSNDNGNIELSISGGSGGDVHWYTESCGGTPVGIGNPFSIASPTINTTYFARWENSCATSPCAFININVVESPVAPTVITSTGNNLCADDAGTINLSAVGGSGNIVKWFTGSCGDTEIGTGNPLNIESPTVTTEYFARWENTCGVTSCISVMINVIDSPTDPVSAQVDISSVCADYGGNISLSITGGAGPQVYWYSNSCGIGLVGIGNPLEILAPTVSTTYFGRYESACGNSNCQSVSVNVVNVSTPPSSAVSNRNNFCSNDDGTINISVTDGSGDDVHWFTESCGGTPIGTGNPLEIESPENTTTYFGRWENSCGVTVCQNITVTVIPSADATITPAGPFCIEDSPDVIAAAQIGGTWSGNGINSGNGLFNPEDAGIGEHLISYTISGTCGDTDAITITVVGLFDATINPVDPLCSNEAPITLTAATAGGTWSGTGITNANTGTFDPTNAGAGNHLITYTYSGLCGNSDNITISVVQKADATINAAGPFCVTDDPVVITALQPGGTWSGTAINATTGSFDPETADVGTHVITYFIAGNCGDIQEIVLTVLPLFDATITTVSPMCSGDSDITLTAATSGGTWSGPGITDADAGTFDPKIAGAGNHVINYSYTGTCGSSDDITIVVSPSADATITPVGPFCKFDDPVVLSAAQIGGTWSGTSVNPSNGFFDPELAGVGNHTITYTIAGACGDTDEIIVSVLDLFDATITSASEYCYIDEIITLEANTSGGTWSGNGINSTTGEFSLYNAGIGTYEIIYSYDGQCGDADTINIIVSPLADASITPVDSLYEDDEPILLQTAQGGGTWSGIGVDLQGLFSPAETGVGEFEIIYTIDGNCGDSDTITIIVLKTPIANLLIPTVITPDADGYNDTWRIQGIEAFDNVSIRIFTRWGDEIFVYDGTGLQYADPIFQWNGRRNDKELPSGGYVFILIVNNDETHKGTISLIR